MKLMKTSWGLASLLAVAVAWGQVSLPAGKGSFASYPPSEAGTAVDSFQKLATINVMPGETRPIPTNDWWTNILITQFGGDLWSQPLVTAANAQGVQFWYPIQPADNGDGMQRGNPLQISGDGFAPTRALARDWGDWHVVVRMDAGEKHLDMTLVRGMPTAWFEVAGFQPTIALPVGATAQAADGTPLGAAATILDRLVVLQGAKAIGVHLPAGSTASLQAGVLSLTLPAGKSWFSLSGLPAASDLDAWRAWATVVPRSTKVSWQRTASSTMKVTYQVTGEDLSGAGGTAVLQTFPPHAWRAPLAAPTWRSETWLCPRGRLKAALGTSFSFEYAMPGIVPDYGTPWDDASGTAYPWRRGLQDSLVSAYLAKATSYGNDTYWGGKDLVLLAKHAVFAARTGHPQATALLAKARAALEDWLTWTPGEKAHYFARYPRWKALIGFQSSYGSEQFTDNHFHYGYLIHAAALVGSLDPQFLADYGPALREVAKQYANWEREDTTFPFLRTFEPWTGHSYAGGTSSPSGNNQESTSEAMQSWVGLFLLGSAMGDSAMRDAGAFGYLMESRATLEYWFDWKRENFAPGWAHSNVGIVFDGGQSYGTWFSANPMHIHSIQYLPICPGFDYLARDTTWARSEYRAMFSEAAAANGYTDEKDFGDDWANVAFSFKQLFDPNEVCRRFDLDHAAGAGWTSEVDAGVTYAYAQANRQLGAVAWDVTYSLPTAVGFRDRTTGNLVHVIWNPTDHEVNCEVRMGGQVLGTARIPARAVVRHRLDAKLSRLEIVAPGKTLPLGETTTLSVRGWDQYGASTDLGTVQWSASSGTVDAQGRYTPAGVDSAVVLTVRSGGLSVSLTVRADVAAKLSKLSLHPAYMQMVTGSSRALLVRGIDQYGDTVALPTVSWSSKGGAKVASDGTLTGLSAGTAWVFATAGGVVDSIPVDVYDQLLDFMPDATITASSSNGANLPQMVADGNRTTRWESAQGLDSSWIRFDLGTSREITQVVIDWEAAAASHYLIQTSDDGTTWTTWTEVLGGDGGLDSLSGEGHGKYLRMLGLARTTTYGYSILEMRLRGFPRTAYSALLDADTGTWDSEPSAAIGQRPGLLRPITVDGRIFRVRLPEGETVLSARLIDLSGRRLDASRARNGVGLLRISTSGGLRIERVVLTPP